jgi:hypothetical protein
MSAALQAATEPVSRVLARLQSVRRAGRGWTARCPSHDDRDPSLSVSAGDVQSVVLRCHGGCAPDDVLRAIGLTWADLTPSGESRTPRVVEFSPARAGHTGHLENGQAEGDRRTWPRVASYVYEDEHGAPVFRVDRHESPVQVEGRKRKKSFVQFAAAPDGGWRAGLDGVDWRPLYGLPEVSEAIALGKPVLLVEGEKCVEAARALGCVATCNAGGAKGWRPEHAEQLAGADVVILPDQDENGRAWAEAAGTALTAAGARVRMLALPDVPGGGGDLADWHQAGGTPAQLAPLLERAPRWQPGDPVPIAPDAQTDDALPSPVCLLGAPTEPPVRWLVLGFLPRREPALIAGPEGEMKSTIAYLLACAVAGGGQFLGFRVAEPGPVLIVSGEDSRAVIDNRIRAIARGHGWNSDQVLGQLHVLDADGADVTSPRWQQHLRGIVERLQPALVILDPLANLAGGEENKERPELRRLWRGLTRPSDAAVVLVHHAGKKGDGSKSKRDRIRGHTDVVAASRATFFVERESAGVVVENIKQSRGDRVPSFVVTPYIETAADNPGAWTLARLDRESVRQVVRTRTESWLLEFLAAYPGSTTADIRAAAQAAKVPRFEVSSVQGSLHLGRVILFEKGERGARKWYLADQVPTLPDPARQGGGFDPADPAATLPWQGGAGPSDPACRPYRGRQGQTASARDDGRVGRAAAALLDEGDDVV